MMAIFFGFVAVIVLGGILSAGASYDSGNPKNRKPIPKQTGQRRRPVVKEEEVEDEGTFYPDVEEKQYSVLQIPIMPAPRDSEWKLKKRTKENLTSLEAEKYFEEIFELEH